MKCTEFESSLDAYLDGEISTEGASSIEAHAASCATCSGRLQAATDLNERIAGLARSIPPSRDLWPGISARLEPRETVVTGRFGRPLASWMAVAAMALVAVGSVLVAYTVGRQHAQTVIVRQQATPMAVPARTGGDAAAVEAEFLEARDELMSALDQRQGTLSPETLEVVYENMRVIDAAIERITAALDEDPGNLLLASQLTTAYQRQIELLRRANKLPAEI
jgi:anti-sigma factor RsiW